MKILIISAVYPPPYVGGYELACKDIAEGLANRGHDVIILTSSYEMRREAAYNENVKRELNFFLEIQFDRFDIRGKVKAYFFDWRNYRSTIRQIKQFQPDVVYIWSLSWVSPLSILLASYQSGAPVVFHIMDWWLLGLTKPQKWSFASAIIKVLARFLTRRAHLIIMSNFLKNKYLANDYKQDRLHVIYHGISNELRNHMEKSDSLPTFLFVGRLIHDKGLHVALHALRIVIDQLQDESITLDIVGTGDWNYTAHLKDEITKLRLGENIRFLGFLPRQDVVSLYSRYTALIFPSLWEEPFGITIIEAMAAGIPVIASDLGGPAEIITNERTGLLFPAGNARMLANNMCTVVRNESVRNQITMSAKNMVLSKFSLRKSVIDIEACLKNIYHLSRET